MLIFHSPMPIVNDGLSGSAIRPAAMLSAFRELGVSVALVDGPSRERMVKWARCLQSGHKIIGVYSELSTTPIALTDPDHLPRAPYQDFSNFSQLRNNGVPTSAFYRDVYWRFPKYRSTLPWYKYLPSKSFYMIEAWQLSRYVDHIFLPSMKMKKYIPFIKNKIGTSALPPGGQIRDVDNKVIDHSKRPLKLLYVGGVGGEQYDLGPMLRAVGRIEGVQLTLCCREPEWLASRDRYGSLHNVKVVHHSGAQLDAHYRSADIFLMWWGINDYLHFAMPVKLGESVGWGLPVITNADCEMGDFVDREAFGWTPRTEHQLEELILYLRDHRDDVVAKQACVMEGRARHSWRTRAETILSTLQRYRSEQV